jgi:hypothetical protein
MEAITFSVSVPLGIQSIGGDEYREITSTWHQQEITSRKTGALSLVGEVG